MKKRICLLGIIILLILIRTIPVSALENRICSRSENNYQVKDDIIVTSENKNDILNTICVDDLEKVYDFADLLTDSEEKLLYQETINYINKTNYDLAIVTIKTNNKKNTLTYADDFFDYNLFGKNKTRDGVVLLIDMANREVAISTSGYAQKMYDDKRIDLIIDSGYDYLIDANYYNTFSKMITSLTNYYNENYPESNKNMVIDEKGNASYIKYMPYNMIIFISLIVTLIISLILYFKTRLKIKKASTKTYLKESQIINKKDDLINSVVTHTRKAENYSSSGSSSSGGGSSIRSSSSGRSHGGGSRKF